MLQTLRRHVPIVLTAVVTATVFAAGPTVAQAAFDAVNSDKVDGKHAVGASATPADRAGKLVATNRSGVLPNNIINKALDADQLDGSDSSAFSRTGHLHDDRYYPQAQAQARTAPNSLTCATGQYLQSVAADGTPTCGVDTVPAPTKVYEIAGAIGTQAASSSWEFAGTPARLTTTVGQTVLTSVSGVVGSNTSAGNLDFTICRATVGGAPTDVTGNRFMTTNVVVNEREVISATFPTPAAAGTYDYGLCLRPAVDLQLNDWVQGAVTVFN